MNKFIKQILILACLVAILVLPYLVFAADSSPITELKKIQPTSGYAEVTDENTAPKMAGRIVNALFGFLGIIFIILMLMAGMNWMTAAGDEAKVTKARDTIRRAIIGLIIVLSAYVITAYVGDLLLNSDSSTTI